MHQNSPIAGYKSINMRTARVSEAPDCAQEP